MCNVICSKRIVRNYLLCYYLWLDFSIYAQQYFCGKPQLKPFVKYTSSVQLFYAQISYPICQ